MQTPDHVFPSYQHDDEIDLFELIAKLYKQKRLITFVTIVVFFVSIAIAFTLPKSYSTEAIINAPSQDALSSWNSSINLLHTISRNTGNYTDISSQLSTTTDKSFEHFQQFITSPSAKRFAFEHSDLFQVPDDNRLKPDRQLTEKRYKEFLQHLNISTTKNGTRTTISYSSNNPEESARVINTLLIPKAREQYINSLKASYFSTIDSVKKQIVLEIKTREANFQAKNEQRLTDLRESLRGAIAGDIKDLSTSEVTSTVLNQASYLLGSKILKSRIETVQNRMDQYKFYSLDNTDSTTGKPYISGVANLVFQLNQLNQLTVDFESIQPFTLEQFAPIPVSPSKPKKHLIIAIGLILGLMLGVFAALLKIAIQSRKERVEQANQMQKLMIDQA